jgi:DNA ligase-1
VTQIINITIDGNTYTREWGQLNGKQQVKSTVAKPKNVGRSNETSAEEQAILEAKAVWAKKIKVGYSTSVAAPVTVLLPMKVNSYDKYRKKIKFPVYVSPKLDGVNVEYRLIDGKLQLLSRGGEQYPIPRHQTADVLLLLRELGTDAINGEMYVHGEYLQDIQSAVKKPNKLSDKLLFCVFDFPTIEGDYTTRCTYGYKVMDANPTNSVTQVPVAVAYNFDDIEDAFDEAIDDGYEGLIIRNSKGMYKYNTRSLDVFKYKKALDAEFVVSGHEIDKNGHVVFTCNSSNDTSFRVKLKGTNEARLEMAKTPTSYYNKFLKVEYETLSKDGIPLKPVGICFREVDSDGEAIE